MALRSRSDAVGYDVFLSFRGSDTRYGFTGNLYNALSVKGIHTFIDDMELQRGEEITLTLVNAIRESKIAIIVLSKDYASSSFCLDELETILDCMKKGMLVIPVFYKVDPSDIRHHKGSYGTALAKHEERFKYNMDKLHKWKMALHHVANLSGYHFKERDEYEYKFIGSIVDSVTENIKPASLHVADHPVGLESRVAEVMNLMDVACDDGVHMIGIHGMGGVGKSTLARAVYNKLIAEKFDGLCYLENVREKSNKHGLEHLQIVLLGEILRDKNINVTSVEGGASMIQQRLQRKKVLLLLDDVDKLKQLEAIVGRPDWFGPGSRVIITTRDQQLLACHQVKRIYEQKELNEDDALELLTWKAFKKVKADPTYEEVLNCVVAYASGLPLALEVIGSHLFGKGIKDWEAAIDKYKRIPHNQIHDIFKVSFDALENEEKSVFLDTASCFKWYALEEVKDILCARYGHSINNHIGVLVEKSLIKLSYGFVTMHDLIENMGKEIVRQQSLEELGKCSRLWLAEDIIEVLEDNTGTSKIEIIYLNVPISDKEETIYWDGIAFKKMINLKILIIKNGKFSEGPRCLPNSLRVLEWWGYPSHCLPFDFQPKKLAICKLPHGCLTSCKLDGSSKKFINLQVLKFDGCKSLTEISDLSGFPNLEKLSFKECENLVTVHDSIGFLNKLKALRANGCSKLMRFPPLKLTSLEKLKLSHCSSLESFPEILGKMENIREISFEKCENLVTVHDSIGFLNKLQILRANGCSKLVRFPPLNLTSLEQLELSQCSSLERFPEIIGKVQNIRNLQLEGTPIKELPFSFQNLIGLLRLSLHDCGIVQLPSSILMMPELKWVEAMHWKGWQWVKNEEDEEKVGSIVSSKVFNLSLPSCNLNDDFFSTAFMRFAHVGYLDLSGNNFTFLPECIKEFQSLGGLDVNNCKYLREIRGIPPNLQYFNAKHCKSLTPTSASMLLNQELYEAGMRRCCLAGSWIPEWFYQRSRGPSSSFWFRNNFPDKIICLLIEHVEYKIGLRCPAPMVFINGKVHESYDKKAMKPRFMRMMDHTYILQLRLKYPWFEVPLENEWNHVEVTYAGVIKTSVLKASGIHVFKQESSNEDIRFTNPYKLDHDLNSSQS